MRARSTTGVLVGLAVAVQLALSACSWTSDAEPRPDILKGSAPAAVQIAVTPAPGTNGVPITTEIGMQINNGKVAGVKLVDTAGQEVAGEMREDGSSWVPASPLRPDARYTATVTAVGPGDTNSVRQTTFTTGARPSGRSIRSDLILTNGGTYGVGMPIVVQFGSDVPVGARAAIEKRLFVKSDPPQPGAWRWFGARQVMYRPASFWQAGTKITARKALNSVQIGDRVGDTDFTAAITIGRSFVMDIDNATKQMTVRQDGAVVRTVPVSLGKASTPTSSGTTVIMSREAATVFRTPEYTTPVQYAMRLTWGGQYIHAAPWSVGDQGKRNVSHGCTNVSMANARWLYQNTLVGDPVITRNTQRRLEVGDGWTVWDMDWSQYHA
ncbi:Ig-like domain-containing protein [Dactylosporangium sp. NBC_01737]|uniref:L,D-transpeptidase n=1 Tax=Dactylosporangium sp. NBC_01737 TaxID=2975959 RepID=UPI002E13AFD4|nr:Ig-like domain-containing protein [Dactylosporangium sp. NBC_01737]